MPKLFRKDGKEHLELSRSETQRILESKYIAKQISRNIPQESNPQQTLVIDFINAAQKIADIFGSQHLDANGDLKQTERQKAADEV